MTEKINTWIINLRSSDMINNGNNTFSININIPETNEFKKFKLHVKDFIVIRSSTAGNDCIYNLNSNLKFTNSFDSRYGSSTSTLCMVPYSFCYFTSKGSSSNGLEINNINGKLNLWIENYDGIIIAQQPLNIGANINAYISFTVSLYVVGY